MKILTSKIISSILVVFCLIFLSALMLNCNMSYAETTLKTGIEIVENVPTELFGTWRVAAVLKRTDSPEVFRNKSADLWNLSKNNNVMNLNNPFTGATADLAVEFVKGNVVRFTKEGVSGDNKLTDTVELTLNGDKFTGVNTLVLKTFSNGEIIKIRNAEYVLVGEKISGMSVIGK